MSDLRRVTFLAVLFAVLLRMAIGWQFFYEGLWKYESLDTAKPWTAAGYLSNARGPLRDHFRSMVPDPDGLDWLEYDTVDKRWGEWEKQFVEHYELDDKQKKDLALLLNGPKEFVGRGRFREFAKGISIGGTLAREKIIVPKKDNKNRYYLVVDGKKHLTPQERNNLVRLGKKIEDREKQNAAAAKAAGNDDAVKAAEAQAKLAVDFYEAVEDVFTRSSRLSFREQLAAMLKGDPKRVSLIRKDQAPGTVDYKRPSKTSQYIDRLERYKTMLADARQDFQQKHLDAEARRIRELKAELIGPVRKLDADFKTKTRGLLTNKQLAKGLPSRPTAFAEFSFDNITVGQADVVTMWALMVFGGMLIVGLFSRMTAFFGALLVLSFYLVMPPWPGVPAAPGPEHSLIVNKNLIEVAALLALAFIPTGKWFGLDAFFVWLFPGRYGEPSRSRRGKKKPSLNSSKSSKSSGLSPAERVVKSGDEAKESEKQEPAKAAVASKDTYSIQPNKKK